MNKFMYKTLIIALLSFLSSYVFTCESDVNNTEFQNWIGSNSNFSKSFIKGKCALNEALNLLPLEERKIIANLIAKSYTIDIKSLDKLKTFNY